MRDLTLYSDRPLVIEELETPHDRTGVINGAVKYLAGSCNAQYPLCYADPAPEEKFFPCQEYDTEDCNYEPDSFYGIVTSSIDSYSDADSDLVYVRNICHDNNSRGLTKDGPKDHNDVYNAHVSTPKRVIQSVSAARELDSCVKVNPVSKEGVSSYPPKECAVARSDATDVCTIVEPALKLVSSDTALAGRQPSTVTVSPASTSRPERFKMSPYRSSSMEAPLNSSGVAWTPSSARSSTNRLIPSCDNDLMSFAKDFRKKYGGTQSSETYVNHDDIHLYANNQFTPDSMNAFIGMGTKQVCQRKPENNRYAKTVSTYYGTAKAQQMGDAIKTYGSGCNSSETTLATPELGHNPSLDILLRGCHSCIERKHRPVSMAPQHVEPRGHHQRTMSYPNHVRGMSNKVGTYAAMAPPIPTAKDGVHHKNHVMIGMYRNFESEHAMHNLPCPDCTSQIRHDIGTAYENSLSQVPEVAARMGVKCYGTNVPKLQVPAPITVNDPRYAVHPQRDITTPYSDDLPPSTTHEVASSGLQEGYCHIATNGIDNAAMFTAMHSRKTSDHVRDRMDPYNRNRYWATNDAVPTNLFMSNAAARRDNCDVHRGYADLRVPPSQVDFNLSDPPMERNDHTSAHPVLEPQSQDDVNLSKFPGIFNYNNDKISNVNLYDSSRAMLGDSRNQGDEVLLTRAENSPADYISDCELTRRNQDISDEYKPAVNELMSFANDLDSYIPGSNLHAQGYQTSIELDIFDGDDRTMKNTANVHESIFNDPRKSRMRSGDPGDTSLDRDIAMRNESPISNPKAQPKIHAVIQSLQNMMVTLSRRVDNSRDINRNIRADSTEFAMDREGNQITACRTKVSMNSSAASSDYVRMPSDDCQSVEFPEDTLEVDNYPRGSDNHRNYPMGTLPTQKLEQDLKLAPIVELIKELNPNIDSNTLAEVLSRANSSMLFDDAAVPATGSKRRTIIPPVGNIFDDSGEISQRSSDLGTRNNQVTVGTQTCYREIQPCSSQSSAVWTPIVVESIEPEVYADLSSNPRQMVDASTNTAPEQKSTPRIMNRITTPTFDFRMDEPREAAPFTKEALLSRLSDTPHRMVIRSGSDDRSDGYNDPASQRVNAYGNINAKPIRSISLPDGLTEEELLEAYNEVVKLTRIFHVKDIKSLTRAVTARVNRPYP
uniref:Uncharacterized protein n=1 Tax=Babesia bovis TaxID=5865 RepID=A7AUR0_BABBO|eukprot:XP_001610239.1 hypothetical protein [Babesia bovis T2Bo]